MSFEPQCPHCGSNDVSRITDRVGGGRSLRENVIVRFDGLAIVRLLRFVRRTLSWKKGILIFVTILALLPVLLEVLPFVMLPVLVIVAGAAMFSPILLFVLPLLALGRNARRVPDAARRCAACGETFRP